MPLSRTALFLNDPPGDALVLRGLYQRRLIWLGVVAALLSVPSAGAMAQDYSDASCRRYPPRAVLAEIKGRVETLRRTEREAADRLIGLDTRPYDWLLGQARSAEAVIAVPALLAAEGEALQKCRVFIPPLRRDCAIAAGALVRVIEDLVAGEPTNEARMALAQTMPHCERAAGLTPIDTALRALASPPERSDGRRDGRTPPR
jgi:hypothetical protein